MFSKKKIQTPVSNIQGATGQSSSKMANILTQHKAIAKKSNKLSSSQIKALIEKAKEQAKEATGKEPAEPKYTDEQWQTIISNSLVYTCNLLYKVETKEYTLDIWYKVLVEGDHWPCLVSMQTKTLSEIQGLMQLIENPNYTIIYDFGDKKFEFYLDPDKSMIAYIKNEILNFTK